MLPTRVKGWARETLRSNKTNDGDSGFARMTNKSKCGDSSLRQNDEQKQMRGFFAALRMTNKSAKATTEILASPE